MRKYPLILLLIPLLISCETKEKKDYNIGQRSVTFFDSSRDRPLVTEIWYPTRDTLIDNNAVNEQKIVFKTMKTIPNASIPNGKFPLLLFSHGTGGNRFSLTWFVEEMVKKGYIAVSVDHYGNSTDIKLPREFVKWWERAIDMQYVLGQVFTDPEIGPVIDTARIGGVGFSLGGYTNIALAGGYVDRTYRGNEESDKRQRELPPEFPKTDEDIDFENDSLIVASFSRYAEKVKDDRIKAFFVMAPAIGFGFHSTEQTREITAPVFIVAGESDTNTPIEYNAVKYHQLIKTSEMQIFEGPVTHYVFLNEATDFGKTVVPQLCVDHPDVDRKEIHDKTLKLAIDFFGKHL